MVGDVHLRRHPRTWAAARGDGGVAGQHARRVGRPAQRPDRCARCRAAPPRGGGAGRGPRVDPAGRLRPGPASPVDRRVRPARRRRPHRRRVDRPGQPVRQPADHPPDPTRPRRLRTRRGVGEHQGVRRPDLGRRSRRLRRPVRRRRTVRRDADRADHRRRQTRHRHHPDRPAPRHPRRAASRDHRLRPRRRPPRHHRQQRPAGVRAARTTIPAQPHHHRSRRRQRRRRGGRIRRRS